MNKIKETIKESERNFQVLFINDDNEIYEDDCNRPYHIEDFIKQSQTKLIENIIEEIEERKKEVDYGMADLSRDAFKNLVNKGYNQALEDITNLLKENI